MPDPTDADVATVSERLAEQGIDVVRVSYPDMIGVDRGRDVLLGELGAAVSHGLAFCRAVYHTSPMGDVVPVQGGLEEGLEVTFAGPAENEASNIGVEVLQCH